MKKYVYAIIAISALATAVSIGLTTSQVARKPAGVASDGLDWGKDPHTLVGFTHDVFVGKVLRVVGNDNYPISGYPSTEFEVQVIYNIKGNLQNTITIAELHGNVIPLAQVNSTYIFAVHYDTLSGWYLVGIPTESYQLLTDDASLSDAELKSLAMGSRKVRDLEKAYPDETVFPPDLKNNTAYNSYASRHYDAQGNLIDDTVVLHEQYLAAHPSSGALPAAPESAAPGEPSAAPTSDATSPTPSVDTAVPASDSTSLAPTEAPSHSPASTDTPLQ